MKRSANPALAAMLLCLAMAGLAGAQDDPTDLSSADGQEAPMSEDESQSVAIDSFDEAPPDDGPGTTTAVEDDTATASENEASENEAPESGQSEGKKFRNKLKRMLIGLLLPAVERGVRKAVDDDDGQSQPAPEAGPEFENEYEQDSAFESEP